MEETYGISINLNDSQIALDDTRHQSTITKGLSGGSRRTAPGTRRGSLVPSPSTAGASARAGRRNGSSLDELNLFTFGLKELMGEVLLSEGESHVSYHEYAFFSPPNESPDSKARSPSIMSDGEEGLRMFRKAVRNDHGLDNMGNFTPHPAGRGSLRGRVRQIITDRRPGPRVGDGIGNAHDGLKLTVDDYESLGLHTATLPSLMRVTSESCFWDAKKETLYLMLSFSPDPQPPYDFLSMTYKLRTKTTTALIRRSFDTRWHGEDCFNEYEQRFDSCRTRWAHPLVLPIVLLQVQMLRTEEAVITNNGDVLLLEERVDAVTGTTGQDNAEAFKRNKTKGPWRPRNPLKRLSSLKDYVEEKVGRETRNGSGGPESSTARQVASLYDPEYVPPQTIFLMKQAHEVLKGTIQLLDTLRWKERAVKLLIQIGDELEERFSELQTQAASKDGRRTGGDDDAEHLSADWYEIRQYLDYLLHLCVSLEIDRRSSEQRCKARIQILYTIMAQEDNNLNARIAVASTRDSSSMKALAVITAIFLPGEYIGTLFGLSMFNWQKGTAGDPAAGKDAADELPSPTIMPSFWIYWAFTLPLTLLILSAWRGWWVNQDRYFRRHLSNELSNERYWTKDGRPRNLTTTFTQDFFSLFSFSGARSTTNRTVLGNRDKGMRPLDGGSGSGSGSSDDRAMMMMMGKTPRFRQISFEPEPRHLQKHGTCPV